ncbi:hypothetical protein E1A91_D10G170500v1 [Gossypium mustelinum]|uniref:GOLD domain-containing protein n=3 Tax=Gossypium TaxID=3633 RepID=A0A5D2TBC4_GOSMU|nr:hypothetical protein ES288_D10G178600v1 [Gossypium darwinii]TYH50092.1 hypothetical protein ES332_D10G180900v1 [Gossypium tomentosum]TYI61398.1 hypothetical protein E1A91_D10G170500v1 [Gossypium mustelinum]
MYCLITLYNYLIVIYVHLYDWYMPAANESTRKRVIGYTVGEYLLLVAASVLQVIYIRRLFSKSVAYNRV